MEEADRAEVEKMVAKAAKEAEARLVTGMAKAMEPISKKIDLAIDLNTQSKAAFEAVPGLIKEQVANHLTENIASIGEELSKQFEGKMKAMMGGGGDNSGGGTGLGLGQLLNQSDKIIGIVNAFRQPTTEAAMLGQMNLVMKWHSILSKLEKGGGSPDDITKQIADTFTEK